MTEAVTQERGEQKSVEAAENGGTQIRLRSGPSPIDGRQGWRYDVTHGGRAMSGHIVGSRARALERVDTAIATIDAARDGD